MKTEIQKLAAMTGQSEADVTSFLVCLSVWTSKGYTFEQAIAKNLATVERIAERCLSIPKSLVVETFYEQECATCQRAGHSSQWCPTHA